MTVIKINAITVPAEMGPEVASRFAARVGAVDGAPGFEGFELLRPTDDRTQWLVVTRWTDEDSFEAWRASPSFGEGHKTPAAGEGPPPGHGAPGGHGGGEGGERPSPMGLTAELWSYEVQVASSGSAGLSAVIGAATALRDSHEIVGWALVFANAAAATWALAAHYRVSLRRRELWWFTALAQLLVFAQAIIGVVILQQEDLEPPDFHLLYGFSMIVAIGIVYSYRQQMEAYRYLLYAGGGYFLMGLGIRAFILRPG